MGRKIIVQRLFFIFVTLMVFAISASVYILIQTGQFRTITPNFNGLCAAVSGIVGAEDILIHPSGDFAFITSDYRRAANSGSSVPGAIYLYDLRNSEVNPVNLTPNATEQFHPLGLSYYTDSDGRETLMVINRRSRTPTKNLSNQIILYDWINGKLTSRRILESEHLIGPNDIVAVGHNQFYVTNDHGYVEGFMGAIEAYLPLPVGNVNYFNGEGFTAVAEGLLFANGINQSIDGTKVYVTETVGQSLKIYRRDKENGALQLERDVNLGTGPDNITLDEKGDLWIAAHPQLLSFVGYIGDKTKYTPSQIIRLSPGIGGQLIQEDVMVDFGDLISGASVAAATGNRFLVGGPYEEKFLDCSL